MHRASPTSLIPLIHSVPVKVIRPLMQEQENCTRVWPSYLWALLAIFCRKPLTADAHEFSSLHYDTVNRIIEDNLNKIIFRNLYFMQMSNASVLTKLRILLLNQQLEDFPRCYANDKC